ncbi:MAG: C-terminal binding protein [Chitinophagaceae bacterium]|nr:C-terminal binding protein [Chitinophagaceae bacterium]
MSKKVVITDYGFPDLKQEKKLLEGIGYEVVAEQCKTAEEVLDLSRDAEAVMVQWAPVTREVIEGLENCRIIIRYGIGVDNVDLTAAKEKGIPVCNVPDYCIQEVADHAVALALSLGRQLLITDRRVRDGVWKITPPKPMPAFREMKFATVGYGRIAREVLKRAAVFGFQKATCDPFVKAEAIQKDNTIPMSLDQLFEQADIISLHSPLNKETHHLINESSLGKMKSNALLINTSRGGLVDADALADAISKGKIAGAGIDVFEQEPLPAEHPLRKCENVILTSHTAWYSESSIPELQLKATEEAIRGLTGQPLTSRVV